MKKFITLFVLLFTLLAGKAAESKVYLWIKAPRLTANSYPYGLTIAVNNQRMGAIKMREMALLHLQGDKKYFIEIFEQGRSVGSTQINDLTDSISYYQLDISVGFASANFGLNKQESLKGGTYVMNKSNYTNLLDFYEEGVDQNESKGPAYGSGFLISQDGYIVTNNHVIDGYKKIKIKGIEGDYTTEYEADVVVKDASNDLALLQLKNKNVKFTEPPYALKIGGANTGDDIFILGYPLGPKLGDEIKLTNGVISSKSGYEGSVASFQISASAQPGNSGSPVFDNQGNVIGVVKSKIMKAENITYAVKSVYLQALLGMLPSEAHLPAGGTIKDKTLSEKVGAVSKYIYIIACE